MAVLSRQVKVNISAEPSYVLVIYHLVPLNVCSISKGLVYITKSQLLSLFVKVSGTRTHFYVYKSLWSENCFEVSTKYGK